MLLSAENPEVAPSTVGKSQTDHFLFLNDHSKHAFLNLGGSCSTFSHQRLPFFSLQEKMRVLPKEIRMWIQWAKEKRFSWQWFIKAFSSQRLFCHLQYSIHERICFIFSFLGLVETLSTSNMNLKMSHLHKEITSTYCE